MLTTLLLSAAAITSSPLPVAVGNPTVTWDAPGRYIAGSAYNVSIEITANSDGSPIPGWLLTPAAFTVNGKPLSDAKGKEMIPVAAGTKMSLSFDLAPAFAKASNLDGKGFKLGFAKGIASGDPVEVAVCKLAPKGLDFMTMPVEQLSNYQVVMETNRGTMVMEFWPENAPNHVRNYLDLSYTGFYDGLTFHRIMPGFMIQGGCPDGTGSGKGPRTVNAEFTTDPRFKHVPGVLSAARTPDPNSATSQFFVMHGTAAHLDGQYSAFGKLVEGQDVVEKIVMTPTSAGSRPTTTQQIKSAKVIQVK